MAKYVCGGAKMRCSMGSAEAILGVAPTGRAIVRIKGNLMATMTDHKPFVNIMAFGQCQSLANPTVAAATAACNGKLQKMPCVPNTTTPWIGAKMNVRISGEPCLLDNSKLMCAWMGIIEIKDAGHDLVFEGGSSFGGIVGSVASEKKADSIETTPVDEAETMAFEKITVKDILEILKEIESKQGYEAARHYAMNEIDYWKINLLAKRYVNAVDDETKDEEKDNDPNLMPTRFMLLYGADDGKLEENGNLDNYPDAFDGEETQKISVRKLREGLRLLGYEYVEEDGNFDDSVEHAFLTYHWRHGRVKIELMCEENDDEKKPLNHVAEKYGISSWKYLDEEHSGMTDHAQIMEELNSEFGNELLKKKIKEKGLEEYVKTQWFKPGVAYHYVWVPHRLSTESSDELKNLKMYSRTTGRLVAERDLKNDDGKYVAEMTVPNIPMNEVIHLIDGRIMRVSPSMPKKREAVKADEIVENETFFVIDENAFFKSLCYNFPGKNDYAKYKEFMLNIFETDENTLKKMDELYEVIKGINNNDNNCYQNFRKKLNIKTDDKKFIRTGIMDADKLGAFCKKDNTIYINHDLAIDAQHNKDAHYLLILTILHEFGHVLDNFLYPNDTEGDEGAVFACEFVEHEDFKDLAVIFIDKDQSSTLIKMSDETDEEKKALIRHFSIMNSHDDKMGTIKLPFEDRTVGDVEFWGIVPWNPAHQGITVAAAKDVEKEVCEQFSLKEMNNLTAGSIWPDAPTDKNENNEATASSRDITLGSEIWRSHKSKYQYWHSMVPKVKGISNGEIKNVIIKQLYEWYNMATAYGEKNGLHYIGRMLHTIQDSFCYSHCWRYFNPDPKISENKWKIWSFQDYGVQKSSLHGVADNATITYNNDEKQMIGYKKALRASKFILTCYKKNVKWDGLNDGIIYEYLDKIVYAIHPYRVEKEATKMSHDFFIKGRKKVTVEKKLFEISKKSEENKWEEIDFKKPKDEEDKKEVELWDRLQKS